MKFALVSTVDSMGSEFPSHCVTLFETEREAIQYAVKCIVDLDESASYIEDEEVWTLGEDHFETPDDFLDAWQSSLDMCEYFHVKPVVAATLSDTSKGGES